MTRLAAILPALALVSAAGWYVSHLHGEIARLEADLLAEKVASANRDTLRMDQAYRAIRTVRRDEDELRQRYEVIDAERKLDRVRAAADLAAAGQRRVRDLAAARAAYAARGDRLPEAATAPTGGGPTDPIGFLLAIRGEDEADARLADDVAGELRACYSRARDDREVIQLR